MDRDGISRVAVVVFVVYRNACVAEDTGRCLRMLWSIEGRVRGRGVLLA